MALTGAGGVLGLSYQHPTAGERHMLHLHVAHFDPTPTDSSYGLNDRVYVSGGPVVPTEPSVLATYVAVAALWSAYFGPSWRLEVKTLQQRVDNNLLETVPPPTAPATFGGDLADDDSGVRAMYIFRLLSTSGIKKRLMLVQVKAPTIPLGEFEVGASGGGLAARDRDWMSYLSGATGGGVVMPNGGYCFAVTDMELVPAHDIQAASWVLPGAPYLVTG